jgi:hypothetical protein
LLCARVRQSNEKKLGHCSRNLGDVGRKEKS